MRIYITLLAALFIISCSTTKEVQKSNDLLEFRQKHIKDLMAEGGPIEKEDEKYLSFYDVDDNYICDCTYEYNTAKEIVEFTTFSGIQKQYRVHGTAHCRVKDNKISVHLYESMRFLNHPLYKNHLFLPFKDITNGDDTYGGGRYIDVNKKDIFNDKLSIDFNKCYNPYCAYSDGYNCPIPPIENHLDIAILAGEKMYTNKK